MVKYTQTINLAHRAMGVAFKKRAPRCINIIRQIAARMTQQPLHNIKIDDSVNVFVWRKGIKAPPRKIRVTIEHAPAEGEQEKYNPVLVSLAYSEENGTYFDKPKDFRKQRLVKSEE